MANFLSYISPLAAFRNSNKGYQDPFAAAQPHIQREREMYERNYSPYTEAGRNAVGNVSDIYGRMASDPGAYFNELMSAYTPQKGFDEYRTGELMKTLQHQGRIGGYAGTQYDREQQTKLLNELMEADRDKWMDRVLGLHGKGLEGQSNLANLGYNATNSLSTGVGGTYGQEADLAAMGAAQKNMNRNSLISALLGLGGAGLGAAFGGPAGAMAGARIGSSFGGGYGGGNSLDANSWNTRLG